MMKLVANRALAALTLVGLAAGGALAGEGVILLNQARAEALGFPLVLSQPGSYRLASNLVVPNENTTAISITADGVTLDLAGFAILGPTVCTGSPPAGTFSCLTTGTGQAVTGSSRRNVVVRNGTVRGMGADGIGFSSSGLRVEGVSVSHCGGVGIRNSSGGTTALRRCFATRNGGGGIDIGAGSVEACIVAENGSTGIDVDAVLQPESALVADSVIAENGDVGIDAFRGGAVLRGNAVTANRFEGIRAGGGTVQLNAVASNGDAGIELQASSPVGAFGQIFGNAIVDNAGAGIAVGGAEPSPGMLINNVIFQNAGGTIPSGAVETGENVCDDTLTCVLF